MKYKLGDRVPCSIPIERIHEWVDQQGKHRVIYYDAEGVEYAEEDLDAIMDKEKTKCEITLDKQLELLISGGRIVLFDNDDEDIFHGDMRDCPEEFKDKVVTDMCAYPCFNYGDRTVYVEIAFTLEV